MAARTELLGAVERSPQAAAAHDRVGWVGLFTVDGRIEDPVGSRPHVGRADIGRFYDTFIAPRQVVFRRDFDVVDGATVVRDLTIEVAMASELTMDIPAFLRYDLQARDDGWAIAMLRAHWELPAMAMRMLGHGAGAVPASFHLAAALLRNQGIGGTYGFLRGVRGAGRRQKRRAAAFLSAATAGYHPTATSALGAGAVITAGENAAIAGEDLMELLRGGSWTKLIAAGNTVSASIAARSGRGVIFCEIPSATSGITRIRYFGDVPASAD